jgi:hypothetical protein
MKIVAILAFALLVTLANAQGNYKKVCYFANWPYYRSGKLKEIITFSVVNLKIIFLQELGSMAWTN